MRIVPMPPDLVRPLESMTSAARAPAPAPAPSPEPAPFTSMQPAPPAPRPLPAPLDDINTFFAFQRAARQEAREEEEERTTRARKRHADELEDMRRVNVAHVELLEQRARQAALDAERAKRAADEAARPIDAVVAQAVVAAVEPLRVEIGELRTAQAQVPVVEGVEDDGEPVNGEKMVEAFVGMVNSFTESRAGKALGRIIERKLLSLAGIVDAGGGADGGDGGKPSG
jgi:hypothetical protein